MIAKHTLEKSEVGDGVEIVVNEPCEDAVHGKGQHTVKHVHLSRYNASWPLSNQLPPSVTQDR